MQDTIQNRELIGHATEVIHHRRNGDYVIGDVGCAILSKSGNLYLGVCIDTACSVGFCAEHNAAGSMITAGESKIYKIVAVRRRDQESSPQILPPCGRCREFLYQIDSDNLGAKVVLGEDHIVSLRELLPYPYIRT